MSLHVLLQYWLQAHEPRQVGDELHITFVDGTDWDF